MGIFTRHQVAIFVVGSSQPRTMITDSHASASLGKIDRLVVRNIFYLSICWECHHPNWRTPSFFRGVGIPWFTTNQLSWSKDAMYSMSMETLKHSAMTPALLKDAADRDMAKELNKACFREEYLTFQTCSLQPWCLPALKLWKGPLFPYVHAGNHIYICICADSIQYTVENGVWRIWSLMNLSWINIPFNLWFRGWGEFDPLWRLIGFHIPFNIYFSEGVADLIPFEDKLNLISYSIYCSEKVGDSTPLEDKWCANIRVGDNIWLVVWNIFYFSIYWE